MKVTADADMFLVMWNMLISLHTEAKSKKRGDLLRLFTSFQT